MKKLPLSSRYRARFKGLASVLEFVLLIYCLLISCESMNKVVYGELRFVDTGLINNIGKDITLTDKQRQCNSVLHESLELTD